MAWLKLIESFDDWLNIWSILKKMIHWKIEWLIFVDRIESQQMSISIIVSCRMASSSPTGFRVAEALPGKHGWRLGPFDDSHHTKARCPLNMAGNVLATWRTSLYIIFVLLSLRLWKVVRSAHGNLFSWMAAVWISKNQEFNWLCGPGSRPHQAVQFR